MAVLIDGVLYVPAPTPVTGKTVLAALDLRFDSDAGKNLTVRDYLRRLLETLWVEGESFSGKRPFGNSGWEHDLYKPLIAGGFISGRLDADGYVEDYARAEAGRYVHRLIVAAFNGVQGQS